jgi:hypothetical protein
MDTPPVEADFFAGAGQAALTGVAEGIGKAVLSLGGGPRVYSAGGYGMAPPMPEVRKLTPDEADQENQKNALQLSQEFAVDPRTTGTAGQFLHGLTSPLSRFLPAAIVGGPLAGAAAVGIPEGVMSTRELETRVDHHTAVKLGIGNGLFSGAASLLPAAGGGGLFMRMQTGALIQMTAGMVDRQMNHVILQNAGYPEMAKQYQAFDGQNQIADAALGGVFGASHHFMSAPSVVDAARVIKQAEHAENAGPGVPVDLASRDANVANRQAAEAKIISGDETPLQTADVRTVPNPAQDAAEAAARSELNDAAAEFGATPVEEPVQPEPVQPTEPSATEGRIETPEELEAKLANPGLPKTVKKALQMKLDALRNPEQFPELAARLQAQREQEGSQLGRAARNAERAKTEEAAMAKLEPDVQESLAQAQAAIRENPDIVVPNEAGEMVSGADSMKQALEDINGAADEAQWHQIAAACEGRG